MEDAKTLYNQGKLLVRAMDRPLLSNGIEGLKYDCTSWAEEFSLLMNDELSSASSTLIIPGVGVHTYKNIGFLINSDLAECFHISKIDSSSRGNTRDGSFFAKEADFSKLSDLANYIKSSDDPNINEVNINTKIDSVVGLFINECGITERLLQLIYIVKRCLMSVTGIDYPIYSYNLMEGKLNKIELTHEQEEQIIESLKTKQIVYWPSEYEEPVIEDISFINTYRL